MILRTQTNLIVEIIRAQIYKLIEIYSLVYSLRYNKDTRIGGHQINHRDILNPIFNEAFEFEISSSTKIYFTLYANNNQQIGSSEISLSSNTKISPIVSKGLIVGQIHYRFAIQKQTSNMKGYLKHNKNVQSQHYKRKNQRLITKPDRQKSYDVSRSHNLSSTKVSTKTSMIFTKSSKQKLSNKTKKLSGESEQKDVSSSYLKKKQQYKKQKGSVKTQSNSSDLKQDQASKLLILQNQLKLNRRKYVAASRKQIASKIQVMKNQKFNKQNGQSQSSLLKVEIQQHQTSEYIQKINAINQYNKYLKQKIIHLSS